MYTLQLGSLVLNGEIILYAIFGLAGWILLSYRLRGAPEREKLLSLASNAFLIWLLVWKGSLLLFDPLGVIQHPEMLLYYSGGVRGRWLASFAAASYVAYRAHKQSITVRAVAEAATVYVLAGWMAYRLGLSYFEGDVFLLHLSYAGLSALLLLSIVFSRKSMEWRGFVQRAAILVLAMLAINGVHDHFQDKTADITSEEGLEKGQLAPNVQLLDIEGTPVELSDYRGKTVFINFWATWCPPCRAEMPHMQKFYEDFKGEGAVVLGVNMTSTEGNSERVVSFVENYGLTFPIVMDGEGAAMKQYQIVAYPTTYVVDRSGIIRERFLGAIDYETMKRTLRQVD